jgi:hypothetical protein
MKHIKMLGLAAFSAMALVALLGTASASASSFTAGAAGKKLSTKTLVKEVFTITGSSLQCSTIKFEGVTEGTLSEGKFHSETQRVHPVYEGCEAFGFTSGVSITTKGCDYIYHPNTTSTNGGDPMSNLTIVDHPGETCNGIQITSDPPFTTCTVIIPKQTILHAIKFKNTAGGKIHIKFTATEIETNVTASSGLCPLTTGLHTGASGASYNGETEFSAEGTEISYTE